MYVTPNVKTKKELKARVEAWLSKQAYPPAPAGFATLRQPQPVECFSPGPFPCPKDGNVTLEGPHYPEPHKWYAQGVVENGILVKVK